MFQRAPAVTVIIGINGVVFALWQFAKGNVAVEEFMVVNFLVSTAHLQ